MKWVGPGVAIFVIGVLTAAALVQRAHSYTVSTGGTEPCHESIAGRAYGEVILSLPSPDVALPPDKTWRKLTDAILDDSGYGEELDEVQEFMLFSLIPPGTSQSGSGC